MQRLQNISAKLVLGLSKYDSVTNALITLHWLPLHARIEFKIKLCVLVHNIVHGGAPQYMKDMLNFKEKSSRFLRDNKKYILDVPFTRRKTFRDRAFSKTGTLLWNSLLEELRVI